MAAMVIVDPDGQARSVCVSVCVSVCPRCYGKTIGPISMKLSKIGSLYV